MADGNSTVLPNLLASGPFNGWVNAIGKLGFPIAVAAFLVWVFVGIIQGDVSDIKDMQATQTEITSMHARDFESFMQDHHQEQYLLRQVLTQLCINAGSTPTERNRCIPNVAPPEEE